MGATLVIALLVAACGSARVAGPHTITLTLVRHAQSASNASGRIDTSTPGPELTPKGWCQATAEAGQLSANHYDAVFASSMVRTQQTAKPVAQALHEPAEVLPGLREIEAGDYEGQPESNAKTYLAAPMRWLQGDRPARIPGSLDGNEFQASTGLLPTLFRNPLTRCRRAGSARRLARMAPLKPGQRRRVAIF
jgi:hypothetical protein